MNFIEFLLFSELADHDALENPYPETTSEPPSDVSQLTIYDVMHVCFDRVTVVQLQFVILYHVQYTYMQYFV